ncbi:14584_t:CDS:2 [Entrophospora sp. SA101]|nr:14584_t:CDS:2 [Entrophospora sp. SA101]
MIAYREKPNVFQSLKWTQLIFSFVVFILEMIQLGSNTSLSNKNLQQLAPFISISGEKLFVYFAFSLSIFTIAIYLVKFKTIWSRKNGPFIWLEVSLLMLWFAGSIINSMKIFMNYHSEIINSTDKLPQEAFTSFNAYIASMFFSWLNVILFMVSLFMTYKVNVEKSKINSLRLRQQAKTRNVKVIKYSRNSEQKRVTFIRNNEKDVKEKQP